MDRYSLNAKNYKLKKEQIRNLINGSSNAGCYATDKITVEGRKIGYMYREEPDLNSSFPDSGWRFLSGDEDEEYLSNSGNIGVYELNTICNYDSDIISFLNEPYGSSFYRDEKGNFQKES